MPKEVVLGSKVTQVSAGGFHTLALCISGELYAWGNSAHGECGIGEFTETNKPRLVKFPEEPIQQMSAGGHHSLVLTTSG